MTTSKLDAPLPPLPNPSPTKSSFQTTSSSTSSSSHRIVRSITPDSPRVKPRRKSSSASSSSRPYQSLDFLATPLSLATSSGSNSKTNLTISTSGKKKKVPGEWSYSPTSTTSPSSFDYFNFEDSFHHQGGGGGAAASSSDISPVSPTHLRSNNNNRPPSPFPPPSRPTQLRRTRSSSYSSTSSPPSSSAVTIIRPPTPPTSGMMSTFSRTKRRPPTAISTLTANTIASVYSQASQQTNSTASPSPPVTARSEDCMTASTPSPPTTPPAALHQHQQQTVVVEKDRPPLPLRSPLRPPSLSSFKASLAGITNGVTGGGGNGRRRRKSSLGQEFSKELLQALGGLEQDDVVEPQQQQQQEVEETITFSHHPFSSSSSSPSTYLDDRRPPSPFEKKEDRYKSVASFSSLYASYTNGDAEITADPDAPPVPPLPPFAQQSSQGLSPPLSNRLQRRKSRSTAEDSSGVDGEGNRASFASSSSATSGSSPLPSPAPTPTTAATSGVGGGGGQRSARSSLQPPPQVTPIPQTPTTPRPKHHHALLELLTSEQSYTSDLALLTTIYIPLALGLSTPFLTSSSTPGLTPSSSRTLSTATSSSGGQVVPGGGDSAMTDKDVEIVFGNVEEIARLSEQMGRRLEGALERLGVVGSSKEEEDSDDDDGDGEPHRRRRSGGSGEDEETLGEVLLDMLPHLEGPYTRYITNHPRAVDRFALLSGGTPTPTSNSGTPTKDKDKEKESKDKDKSIGPTTSLNPYASDPLHPTPQFTSYLSTTRSLASALTNAWDVPSLLIKPVQRLMKYSLLIASILSSTSSSSEEIFDSTEREQLEEAKRSFDQLVMRVNESRRRLEVVRGVLSGNGKIDEGLIDSASVSKNTKEKGGESIITVTLNPQLISSRLRSVKIPLSTVRDPEALVLETFETRLRHALSFIDSLEKGMLSTLQRCRVSNVALGGWAKAFGKLIGMGESHGSEALSAFEGICESGLPTSYSTIMEGGAKRIFKHLEDLKHTHDKPSLLLKTLTNLEMSHRTLLNLPYSKHRPPPSLVKASQSYVALSVQLRLELPEYLVLLEKGVGRCLVEWAGVQAAYWRDVGRLWGDLWMALGMEGGGCDGAGECVRVWWERFEEVERFLNNQKILKHEKIYPTLNNTATVRRATSQQHHSQQYYPQQQHSRSGGHGRSQSQSQPHSYSHPYGVPLPNSPPSSYQQHQPISPQPRPPPQNFTYEPTRQSIMEYAGDYAAYQRGMGLEFEQHQQQQQQQHQADSFERNRRHRGHTAPQPPTSPSPQQQQRRGRSNSQSQSHSQSLPPPSNVNPPPYSSRPPSHQEESLYTCTTVHPFVPPPPSHIPSSITSTYPHVFLSLPQIGERVQILQELGSPSTIEGFCSIIEDDGQDCLLVGRDEKGVVGWVLASFLVPIQ